METPTQKILTARMGRITELFEAPPRDPWRDGPELQVSGLDQILHEYKKAGRKRGSTVRLVVAAAPAQDEALIARAPLAWKNTCLAMAARCSVEALGQRKTGFREAITLLPVMIGALALSAFFDHTHLLPDAMNRLFSEGFVIIGWVILWHPVDLLVFGAGESRVQRRRFENLAQFELEIVRE